MLAPILFKNQSALMPLLLLFRKKSRWLRLFACKRAHDASAALPTFCGASAVLFRHNIHIANSMQKRLKRLFFLWHFNTIKILSELANKGKRAQTGCCIFRQTEAMLRLKHGLH
ncbi:hypothetical protein MR810_09110 [bacterium]|nr:hypothetical protein [bacterium]